MEFINSLLAFIVSIGILITFHEYGHFCVAKFFDVKILRFSIGFGKSIFIKHFGKDETEFLQSIENILMDNKTKADIYSYTFICASC